MAISMIERNFSDIPENSITWEQLPYGVRARIEEQDRTIERLTTRLRIYEEFDHVPKEVFSHSQKSTVRRAIKALQEGYPREDGMVEVFTRDFGQDTDQGRKTIGTHLKRAHALGVLNYKTEMEWDEKTHKVVATHVFIGPTLLTFDPCVWRTSKELARKVGGYRPCPYCGSVHLRTRVTISCKSCGKIISDTGDGTGTAMIAEPDEEPQYACKKPEYQIDTAVLLPEPEGVNRPVYPTPQPEGQIGTAVFEQVSEQDEETDSPPMADPDRAIITAWLEKRIGVDPAIFFATGNLKAAKYLPVHGPAFLDAFIDGVPGEIYASRMRQSDGSSWVWSADIDDKGITEQQVKDILKRVASAGVRAIYWRRRPGRGHFEVYLSEARKAEDVDAFMLQLVPEFVALNERYPIHTNRLSWPLWYQLDKTVHACSGYYSEVDAPHQVRKFTMDTDQLTLHELAMLIESSVTPSALIPRLPDPEPTPEKPRLDRKNDTVSYLPTSCDNPTKEQLIAAFNEANRITDYLPSEKDNADGTYMSRIRESDTGRPSAHVHPETNSAFDYGTQKYHDCFDAACYEEKKSKSEKLSELRKEWDAARHQDTHDQAQPSVHAPEKPVEASESAMGGLSVQEMPTMLFPAKESTPEQALAYDGPYAPEDRACMLCGEQAWQWNEAEQKYECGVCHPKEVRCNHAA